MKINEIVLSDVLPKIGPNAFVVLCIIEDLKDPPIKVISKKSGMSVYAVRSSLKVLEEKEMIRIYQTKDKGRFSSCVYVPTGKTQDLFCW